MTNRNFAPLPFPPYCWMSRAVVSACSGCAPPAPTTASPFPAIAWMARLPPAVRCRIVRVLRRDFWRQQALLAAYLICWKIRHPQPDVSASSRTLSGMSPVYLEEPASVEFVRAGFEVGGDVCAASRLGACGHPFGSPIITNAAQNFG